MQDVLGDMPKRYGGAGLSVGAHHDQVAAILFGEGKDLPPGSRSTWSSMSHEITGFVESSRTVHPMATIDGEIDHGYAPVFLRLEGRICNSPEREYRMCIHLSVGVRLLAVWSTTMRISWLRCRLILFAVCAVCVAPRDARAETITLDFSEPGVGPFDPNYFATRGVLFQPGLFVGFVQGDEALISNSFGSSGPFAHSITGRFAPEIEVASMSIRVALTFQYVSDLQLALFDQDTNLISRTTLRLNQIEGDPGFMGFGYLSVDLAGGSRPASSFLILNQFVRSPTAVGSEFGVSEITITPVPEPSGIGLLALGLVATGVLRRLRH